MPHVVLERNKNIARLEFQVIKLLKFLRPEKLTVKLYNRYSLQSQRRISVAWSSLTMDLIFGKLTLGLKKSNQKVKFYRVTPLAKSSYSAQLEDLTRFHFVLTFRRPENISIEARERRLYSFVRRVNLCTNAVCKKDLPCFSLFVERRISSSHSECQSSRLVLFSSNNQPTTEVRINFQCFYFCDVLVFEWSCKNTTLG